MEYLDKKFLLFSENSTEANLWSVNFNKVGLLESNLEFQSINIVTKLQDKSYAACVILTHKSLPRAIHRVLSAIRTNRLASLVPVAVIAPGASREEVNAYFESGANYVAYAKDSDLQVAAEICYILGNFLRLLNKYKMGRDNRFLR